MDLAAIRKLIDALDDDMLRLLNERARLVGMVGALKERLDAPFYVPSRERAIVERLTAANAGPFPNDAIRPVFQEIFSACLSLEKKVRVAFFGAEGSYTHQAAKRQFGLSARVIPVSTIAGVFEEVERGAADFGIVPVENSTEGVVNHTLDTFVESELKISAEIVLEISHCLLARPGAELADIQRVYSHPQALAQCRRWISSYLPGATVVEALSTSEAARTAASDPQGAAIASEMAARLYELEIIRRKIEDLTQNVTRFLVIGKVQADATGRDKTSVLMVLKDEPGILYRVLEPLSKRQLNLTKIESRPSRRRPWEYVFFVDVDGHARDPQVAEALVELTAASETMKVLGSYPRAPSLEERPE